DERYHTDNDIEWEVPDTSGGEPTTVSVSADGTWDESGNYELDGTYSLLVIRTEVVVPPASGTQLQAPTTRPTLTLDTDLAPLSRAEELARTAADTTTLGALLDEYGASVWMPDLALAGGAL